METITIDTRFAVDNAVALHEFLASQLRDQASIDGTGVFKERAVGLIGTITPALVWLRDMRGVRLDITVIRFSIELRWIWTLATKRVALLRDSDTGAIREMDVRADIPEDIVRPLKSYLGELPGFDPALPLNQQKSDEPSKLHGYTQFYFMSIFVKLAAVPRHFGGVESSVSTLPRYRPQPPRPGRQSADVDELGIGTRRMR